jgi:beta-glucosidase
MNLFRAVVLSGLFVLLPTVLGAQTLDIESVIGELTLHEKACLITGINTWETYAVPRLGIPTMWMADGPVGLRKNLGAALTDSVPATCFPSAAAMAATWNPELIERVGAGIGAEAHANDVTLLLAPGLNLKRHPLGGRNFEYYSEDPLLSGRIAAAFVRGVQSRGVGATLKHFAVNNQEHRRMSINASVDQRTLRELYLRGFEIAVKEGRPRAMMSLAECVVAHGSPTRQVGF